jgi:hypothetical protein
MKTKLLISSIVAAAFVAATPSSWAIPPRQHSASGVIASIDDKTFTLAPSKDAKPLVFVWNKSTRFTQQGSRICSGALEPGLPIRVSYRREFGQLVPREVSVRSDAATRCTTGECCAKRG